MPDQPADELTWVNDDPLVETVTRAMAAAGAPAPDDARTTPDNPAGRAVECPGAPG